MRKFLKVLLVVAVVAVVCVAGYGINRYLGDKKTTSSETNNTVNNTSSGNNMQNVVENAQNSTSNVVENAVDENSGDDANDKINEESNLSDDDKAIDLAKKAYGTTDGVYFRIEQMQSNSVYIISVRDNETTRDLAWYTVNVKNGTVK